MTRNLVAYELMSLDGVAEEPSDFITDWDAVMDENLGRVIATQDAVLLGRRTYDDWAAFWPASDIQPFADFINGVAKFVATSSALERPWANSTVITEDVAEFVTELKARPGGDIGVHGSIELTRSLLEAGLVDELRLVVAPVVHLRGRSLFDGSTSRRLRLSRTVATPSGHLLVDYLVDR